jgi:hypothetical protein
MRIFYAAQNTANGFQLPASRIWYNNLFLSLQDMGQELITANIDYDIPMRHAEDSRWITDHRPAFIETLLDAVRSAHRQKPIELFFSYFYNSCITPEVVKEIRDLGIITVNFSCNNVHQFRLVQEIAPAYDWCMVPEKVALPFFKEVGANPIHIQMAANPQIYKPYLLEKEFDVTFVGQKYADRPETIQYLCTRGINARVWGPGWLPTPLLQSSSLDRTSESKEVSQLLINLWNRLKKQGKKLPGKLFKHLFPSQGEKLLRRIAGPPLSDENLIKMFSRSKINLGFGVVSEDTHGKANTHLRLRDFEIPMSGGLYATGFVDELSDYYIPDKEIIIYRHKEELADKLKYYLAHPDEANRVRMATFRRARQNHTWQNRFNQLFRAIGLNSN